MNLLRQQTWHAASAGNIIRRMNSTFVHSLSNSIKSLPMREAVRYKHKNMKWTAYAFNNYVESHANALLDFDFKTGDTIAVWMKDCAEKHVTMLAAVKAGMKIVEIDISINSIHDLREALKLANCKAIYFEPVTETQDNLLLLRKAIPEFYHYDDAQGQFFHSKYYPNLKFFVQTGFDYEQGCLTYKRLFLTNPQVNEVEALSPKLLDSTPAFVSVKKETSGLVKSKEFTHADLLQQESFWFAKNIIEKKYFEC